MKSRLPTQIKWQGSAYSRTEKIGKPCWCKIFLLPLLITTKATISQYFMITAPGKVGIGLSGRKSAGLDSPGFHGISLQINDLDKEDKNFIK
jgi:hypothetical protein